MAIIFRSVAQNVIFCHFYVILNSCVTLTSLPRLVSHHKKIVDVELVHVPATSLNLWNNPRTPSLTIHYGGSSKWWWYRRWLWRIREQGETMIFLSCARLCLCHLYLLERRHVMKLWCTNYWCDCDMNEMRWVKQQLTCYLTKWKEILITAASGLPRTKK